MKILSKTGDPNIAEVFVAEFRHDPKLLAEFVDAKDPSLLRTEKWVIIVSTQFGCPVECLMCDSGGNFQGNLTTNDIFSQIDHVVTRYSKNIATHCKKLKIQFARMGEPALNPAVLDVLKELPRRYCNPNLIPCIATTAPLQTASWFKDLLHIKKTVYSKKQFQLQFSINSTNEKERDRLMPIRKFNLQQIADFGNRFVEKGDRKASLNFALTQNIEVDANIIAKYFDPKKFCIKITPLNPSETSSMNALKTALSCDFLVNQTNQLVEKLQKHGFDIIISIGEPRENEIGSNCGLSVRKLRKT